MSTGPSPLVTGGWIPDQDAGSVVVLSASDRVTGAVAGDTLLGAALVAPRLSGAVSADTKLGGVVSESRVSGTVRDDRLTATLVSLKATARIKEC